jgi:hypothetical protein
MTSTGAELARRRREESSLHTQAGRAPGSRGAAPPVTRGRGGAPRRPVARGRTCWQCLGPARTHPLGPAPPVGLRPSGSPLSPQRWTETTRSVSAHMAPQSLSMDEHVAPRSPVRCGGRPAPALSRRREQARRDGPFARPLGLPRDGPGSRGWAGRGGESVRRARLRLASPIRPTLARSSHHQSTGLCPDNPAGLRPDPDPLTA